MRYVDLHFRYVINKPDRNCPFITDTRGILSISGGISFYYPLTIPDAPETHRFRWVETVLLQLQTHALKILYKSYSSQNFRLC